MTLSETVEPVTRPPVGAATATLRVAFVGEVDHGKSTLLGRLLYDTGTITPDRLGTDIADGGLAFLLDGLSEERDELFTLDTAQAVMETATRQLVLIDVPGHVELLKNMVTGASRADLGVVVVDAVTGATDQTRRHLRVLDLLGIATVVLAVTKVDTIGYAEARFREVESQFAEMCAECGLRVAAAVPVSAIEGSNVVTADSTRLPWYQGESLLATLLGFEASCARSALVRFVVQAVVGRHGPRRVAGRVESGVLRPGTVLTDPDGTVYAVRRVERYGEGPLTEAVEGDSVGLTLDGPEPRPGTILAPADQAPRAGRLWHTRILVTAEGAALTDGMPCTVRYASTSTTGHVAHVDRRWDSATLAAAPPGAVGFTEFADVRLRFDRPVPADPVGDCAPLGRFMLCAADGRALALGVVGRVDMEDAS
ncbi:GTP-binding protein [Micromonospora chokoriensis]